MDTADFQGVFPYLVSPVRGNGTIDTEVLSRLCDDLIEAGVHGLTPLGSTGEFAYLNGAQRRLIVETTISAARGRVPVVPGVAAATTADAVAQARDYEQMGSAGILAILEAYFPLSDEAVYSYFAAIGAAVSVPVVLYTNPNFQRSDLSLAVLERLSEIDTICYLKDASSNTGRLLSIINATGNRLRVFSASAHIPACVMLIGGVGWMAGPACLIPEQSVRLFELCRSGIWAEAMALQRRLWELNEEFVAGNLAACIKAGLVLKGCPVGDPIPPQLPLSTERTAGLRRALETLGVL